MTVIVLALLVIVFNVRIVLLSDVDDVAPRLKDVGEARLIELAHSFNVRVGFTRLFGRVSLLFGFFLRTELLWTRAQDRSSPSTHLIQPVVAHGLGLLLLLLRAFGLRVLRNVSALLTYTRPI